MKKIFGILGLAALCSFSAFGSACVVDNNSSFGAGTLDTPSGTCTIGGYTFSNFELYGGPGTWIGGLSFSVTVVGDSLQFDMNNLGSNDLKIYFQGTPGVTDVTLSGGPGQNTTEYVCGVAFSASTGGESCSSPLNVTTLSSNDGSTSTSMVTFASTDYFVKDTSGGSQVTQSFVPEPMTFSLVGAGLLGLGLVRRKLRK